MEVKQDSLQALHDLQEEIAGCETCPRLRAWCQDVAEKKVKRYQEWDYWGKPVAGFGDPEASLIIVGLAPGAHGANRTGRVFTGDESGVWLYDALHRYEFANQPAGTHQGDGLELIDAYINNVVRCAPPDNKPNAAEIKTCRGKFLVRELELLKHKKVVLALGKIAFENYVALLKEMGKDVKGLTFSHGALYRVDEETPWLLASYHPSQQNTRTGRLTKEMWYGVFAKARELVDGRKMM